MAHHLTNYFPNRTVVRNSSNSSTVRPSRAHSAPRLCADNRQPFHWATTHPTRAANTSGITSFNQTNPIALISSSTLWGTMATSRPWLGSRTAPPTPPTPRSKTSRREGGSAGWPGGGVGKEEDWLERQQIEVSCSPTLDDAIYSLPRVKARNKLA